MKQQFKIEEMANGAFAIARDEKLGTIFIENACPGDLVEAEIYDERKGFAYASLVELEQTSELRESNPPCKIHKICGSCQWQHISYAEQLKFKKKNLEDLIKGAQIDCSKLEAIPDLVGMESPWNYRNKIIYPVKTVPSTGRMQAGYFKRNSNELINVKYCPIQYSIFDEIMEKIKYLCSERHYPEKLIRHIMLRSNIDFSQILVSFIVRKEALDKELLNKIKADLRKLEEEFEQIVSTTINYNDLSTNVILGQETEIISGTGYITEKFGDIKLELSTTSFFQVNSQQFLKIIDWIVPHVIARTKQSSPNKILDAYCGIGTISLSLASKIPELEITGIELVESAITDAKRNAELNSIKNSNFICSKMEDSSLTNNYDSVILNPPRKGCTNKVLDAIAAAQSQQLIYVSCNPATLCRDIKYLETYGYKLEKIQSFDMFPHSFHFETVALLIK